jgi:predicted nucleic acid-binding Zn ribbon protein
MADTRRKMPRPVAVADLLATVFQGKPAEKRLKEGKIWLVWDAAVGAQIAGKAHPVSFRDGILTVAVSSAPWMQQLTFLKQGMVEKLNELIGSDLVRDIYLKASQKEAVIPARQSPRNRSRQLTPHELARIASQTATISDPELREAFARILARDRETTTSES